MIFKNFLPVVNLVLIIGLIVYIVINSRKDNSAYILNEKVFAEFRGTKDLEKKLQSIKTANQGKIDSLHALMRIAPNEQVLQSYQRTLESIHMSEQQLSARYTEDIWKSINQYVSDFAKQNNYKYVFGATGDGNLMYADDKKNITEEVIVFINKKYAGD